MTNSANLPQSQSQPLPQPSQSQPLLTQFKSFLEASNPSQSNSAKTTNITVITVPKPLSSSSIKNYVSDINHFFSWLTLALQTKEIKPIHITKENILNYQTALAKTTPPATINRRHASIRRFGQFLFITKMLPANPAQLIKNQPLNPSLNQVLNKFILHLKSEKLSDSTIKNYLSDIKTYLLWAQSNIKLTDRDLEPRSSV